MPTLPPLAGPIPQIFIAATAVEAEQAFELGLLNKALAAARTPLLDYLPTLWAATGAGARDAFDAQQMRNATCLCGAGAAAALEGTVGFVSEAAHQAGPVCSGAGWARSGCADGGPPANQQKYWRCAVGGSWPLLTCASLHAPALPLLRSQASPC